MGAKKTYPAKRGGADDAMTDEAAAWLTLALPQVAPPGRVKTQLLARVRAAHGASLAAPDWRFAALAGDAGWVRLPFPGVKMREVTIDAERDTALIFVEMAPGAIFPDHEHTAPERGVVLTGDLEMSGRQLRAGDFYEAAAGTWHERIASRKGCTGLLWVGAEAWRSWRAALAAVH